MRAPKTPALLSRVSGTVTAIEKDGSETVIHVLPDAANVKVPGAKTTARAAKKDSEYRAPFARQILVKVGSQVQKGDFLTDGSGDLDEMFVHIGRERTQEYIIAEIMRIYELQGVSTGRKHLEVIVKQMFSRISIINPGSTGLSAGDIVADFEFERLNTEMRDAGKDKQKARDFSSVSPKCLSLAHPSSRPYPSKTRHASLPKQLSLARSTVWSVSRRMSSSVASSQRVQATNEARSTR